MEAAVDDRSQEIYCARHHKFALFQLIPSEFVRAREHTFDWRARVRRRSFSARIAALPMLLLLLR